MLDEKDMTSISSGRPGGVRYIKQKAEIDTFKINSELISGSLPAIAMKVEKGDYGLSSGRNPVY